MLAIFVEASMSSFIFRLPKGYLPWLISVWAKSHKQDICMTIKTINPKAIYYDTWAPGMKYFVMINHLCGSF